MLSKEVAISNVRKIVAKQESSYHLVSFQQYRQGKNLRSKRYESFQVLCYINSFSPAGWLVCKYVLHGSCKLTQGLLTFNTASGGTGRLERHLSLHEKKPEIATLPRQLPNFSKAVIARCAALAVALDLRPISFTDKQEGLSHFVDSIFRAGQATPVNDHIDTKSILPCTKSVSKALSILADDNRGEYKGLLPMMIQTGGAVTTDGVTLTVQDKQFYDLTLHYIECSSSTPFDITPKFRLRCRTLLLQEKKGEANAEQLRSMLGRALKDHYDCDMDDLTEGFTMVTDNASTMARVARSSLPDGYKLIQEVETRFGTTYLVVLRFLKSAALVEEIISSKDSAAAKAAFESLRKTFGPSGHVSYPALEAIVDCFSDVIDLQTAFQAAKYPTIHLALPKFQRCRDKLRRIVDGGPVSRGGDIGLIPAPPLSRSMSLSTIEWLDAKIRMHPLMMAGCYMNPLFREFQFLEDMNKRRNYRNGCEAMVRSLLSMGSSQAFTNVNRTDGAREEDSTVTVTSNGGSTQQSVNPNMSVTSNNHPAVVGRKRTYSMLEYADSHFQSVSGADEVSRYNAMDMSQLSIDRTKFMEDHFAVLTFWQTHRSAFPGLYKVALRLFAIPVSSCASERVFSALNRIATRDRARLSANTLEEIIVVRSLLSDA